MRRVVITGLGLVTPLGANVETVWANILASQSGAGPITRFDASDQLCRIACEVKAGDGTGLTFDANKRVDYKVQRQVDPFIVYGIDAAGQAIEDAGLTDMTEEERERAQQAAEQQRWIENTRNSDDGLWDGSLYVFDDRMAMDFSSKAKTIGECESCSAPTKIFVNCSNIACHKLVLLCEACAAKDRSNGCEHDLSKKRDSSLIG